MPSYIKKRITCPCCGNEFESRLLKGYSIIRKNTDLDTNPHNPAIYDKVVICPSCGYSTSEPDNRIDDSTCSAVYSSSYQRILTDSSFDNTGKKLVLSGLAYSSGNKPKKAAHSFLLAYWYLKEHGCDNADEACENAIDCFEEYLSTNEDHEAAMILVDLLRQMARFAESLETLRSLDFYIDDEPIFQAISEYEKKLIIDKDCEAHKLSEVTA